MSVPYEYTLKEWFDHVGYFAARSLEEPATSGPQIARDYFREHYPDPDEARYKMERFVAAETYLDQHWDEFEAAGFALASTKTGNRTRALTTALYRFYSHATDETLRDDPPPVESMIRWARESEQAWKPKP